MPCIAPISAYRALIPNENGKRKVYFSYGDPKYYEPIQIPCGQCIGCRLERSRKWAVRCMLESHLYGDKNMFLTLTFDDKKCDVVTCNDLIPSIFTDFLKKLRYYCGSFRYFHCGEYGDKYERPHHHAIIFGLRFDDLKFKCMLNGYKVYHSDLLDKVWGHGFTSVGEVTFESCAYVARYITKKLTGIEARHYGNRHPEYVTMSRRPGIGSDFYNKYKQDIYPSDFVTIRNGVKVKPGKFFDVMYETDFGVDALEDLKKKRKEVIDGKIFGQRKRFDKSRSLAFKTALGKFEGSTGISEAEAARVIASLPERKTILQQKKEILTLNNRHRLPRSLERMSAEDFEFLQEIKK